MVNGKQKGCKKILVLYTNFGKNRKPEKTNWVMHQYHLGQHEEEKEGELVVSKIFYQTQPRQCSATAGEGSSNNNNNNVDPSGVTRRDHSGSGSCSSKEITTIPHRSPDEISVAAAQISSTYNAMEIPHLKSDHFSFAPFRKSFDEVIILFFLSLIHAKCLIFLTPNKLKKAFFIFYFILYMQLKYCFGEYMHLNLNIVATYTYSIKYFMYIA